MNENMPKINLSLNVMTLSKYTNREIASSLEKVACEIRDNKKEGQVTINDKTVGYWKYINTHNEGEMQ